MLPPVVDVLKGRFHQHLHWPHAEALSAKVTLDSSPAVQRRLKKILRGARHPPNDQLTKSATQDFYDDWKHTVGKTDGM